MLGVSMVSKEEEGHTSEFLNTLPFGRLRIIVEKYGALLATIIQFHMINVILILVGFAIMKDIPQARWRCCWDERKAVSVPI